MRTANQRLTIPSAARPSVAGINILAGFAELIARLLNRYRNDEHLQQLLVHV